MAVRVPKTTRVCINCKINSVANTGKEFHEIFDNVGLELQLPSLVETFFHIDLIKKDKQHICDDCVNRLIELYDVVEHTNEESCKTNNLKKKSDCSNNEESSKYLQNESGNFRYEYENFHKPSVIDQNNTQVNLPKICTNFKSLVSTQGENGIDEQNKSIVNHCKEYENIGDVGSFNKSSSEPFAQQQNQSSYDIAKNFPKEDFDQTGEREVSQDFITSLSSSEIKDEKSDEIESNKHMEFISDDECQNVEINKQSNANIMVGSIQLEIKEQEVSQDCNISLSSSAIKYEKSDELDSNEHMELISDDENKNVEINKTSNSKITVNVCEDIEAYPQNKTYNEKEGRQDLCVEEDRSNHVINSGDSKSLLGELKIAEEKEALLLNASSSEKEFNTIEHIDADEFIEQEDIFADTCSPGKESLIQEIILSEEYDQVELNEYLDKVLITKFQDLPLTCDMECKLCLEKYYSFGELLNHACVAEFEKEQQLSCIIKDCEEHAKDIPTLARHLILKHYDNLESTAICCKCTDCQKTFSNVLDFNKHSCCRNIKRKIGAPKYCKYCDLDFQSLKRYQFHMQFHLKNHRPKICLLCGDLFNNPNDFFEHTQYKHNPKTALACVRCDLFFKDIQVFNNHIEVHEDSKYQYNCAICPKKYTNRCSLNQHMDVFHNNKSKALQCEYCPKKFGYKKSYRDHIKTHATYTKEQTFICSTCGLITRNMEMIRDHIESDNKSPCFSSPVDKKSLGLGYSCENCSLDFCTIKHLKDHRLSDSHSDDLFYCGMCRKSFNTLSHMRFHSFNHNECKEWQKSFPITRYFVCNIGDCQEFYSIWAALYNHKKRPHKTEEQTNSPTEFKCQFCQQLCSSNQSLAIHVAKIHDVKIKCSHCKKNFKSQNILQKHIDKKHTPVECDICLKNFKYRRNLEQHITIVHNNKKRYFCKHCQKGYFHNNRRNYHEKKFHPQL